MHRRRPGVTLIEVLAAIFIMGVGTLAILVLFPLGALNMARALKDDRCGTIAANAHSLAVARDLDATSDTALVNAMRNSPGPGFAAADPNGPSYPVMIDPYFVLTGIPNTSFTSVGPVVGRTPGVPRRRPQNIFNSFDADRWFSFNDDLGFESDGRPKVQGSVLQRQGYYTWAYLMRRLQSNQVSTTQLTVIVYSGRPIQRPTPEPVYPVTPPANAGETNFILSWQPGGEAPALRRGAWLMDVSYSTRRRANGQVAGFVHGNCYRVMDSSPLTATSVQVEVQPALQRGNVQYMVVLENAVEVFERGTLR